MTSPKPVTIEYVDPGDYSGPVPQPLAIIGEEPEAAEGFDPTAIAGYDAEKTQTLTHVEGVLTWVTEE